MKNKPKLPIADLKLLSKQFRESREKAVSSRGGSTHSFRIKGLNVATKELLMKNFKSSTVKNLTKFSKENPMLGEFIKRHNLDKRLFFDATGKQIPLIYNAMKKEGKFFAFNALPCHMGHTYRDRHNHCLICDTSNISFQLRNSSEGYVYIAGSRKKHLMKIGITGNLQSRESGLNKSGYGDTNDWNILYSFFSENIGEIENEVIKRLNLHGTKIPYFNSKKHAIAKEVFYCSFNRIQETLKEIVNESNIKILHELLKSDKISLYQFKNMVKIT